MKGKTIGIVFILLLMFGVFTGCGKGESAQAAGVEDTESSENPILEKPTEMVERFSYALGYLQTRSYVSQGIEIDADYFSAAVQAAVQGDASPFTEEEMNSILMEYQEVLMAEQESQQAEAAEANLAEAEQFLAENGSRDGIVTTDSGLQYEVLTEGDGAVPGPEDVVTVHYRGTLTDGTVFDSSYERGTPATFPLNGVISGWTEGLQLMQVGSNYRLYLHPDLGYGATGAGDLIGPNEILIFDVELLAIEEEEAE